MWVGWVAERVDIVSNFELEMLVEARLRKCFFGLPAGKFMLTFCTPLVPVLYNSDLEWACTCQEREWWAGGFYLEMEHVWCLS